MATTTGKQHTRAKVNPACAIKDITTHSGFPFSYTQTINMDCYYADSGTPYKHYIIDQVHARMHGDT